MTDVVAALIWDKDRFLACQRPAHKARGLLWEFVGGKVEPGETKEEALIRECREELDITVVPGSVFMELVHEYPDLTVRLTLFNASISKGVPKKLEHNDLRWITTDQIPEFKFCPADVEILERLMQIRSGIQAQLISAADPAYREFQRKLIPTAPPESVLGVRVPVLRSLASQMRRPGEGEWFLKQLPHTYLEEDYLHAILISQLKDPLPALEQFLPHVQNWAVCDAISPKAFGAPSPELMEHVKSWLKDSRPYIRRFGLGVLMKYFLEDRFEPDHLTLAASVNADDYYVKMMIAWYFATALAKQYDEAVKVLENRLLEPWVHNKTLQKALESYRVTQAHKEYLKSLKLGKDV